ncbi:MAG: oxidoreductase, partial [Geminicoccaceae bacterium]|nr:oxidoreductase [Geminicoccaceae bacterium]
GKARARPDQVKKVVATMAQLGPVATYQKVMNRLDSYTPLGYSLAGVVVAPPSRPSGRSRCRASASRMPGSARPPA